MIIIQLCFIEGNTISNLKNQREFREGRIAYYTEQLNPKNLGLLPINCRRVSGSKTKEGEHKIENDVLCEGFSATDDINDVKAQDTTNKIEMCSLINESGTKYEKINNLDETLIEISDIQNPNIKNKYGCGYCFDNDKVLFGDAAGGFENVGKKFCEKWVKPGGDGLGGTEDTQNIFAKTRNKFVNTIKSLKNKGVKFTTKKMYEQRLCAQMKDCGDNTYKNENGEDLCGWCYMGRNGDGEGEGMVRKGGSGTDQNETKYLDDYCPWPGEVMVTIDSDGNKKHEKTELFNKDTPELIKWKNKSTNNKRLLHGINDCGELNQTFPCFNNFLGIKKDSNGQYIGHSQACYNDLWTSQAVSSGCSAAGLPNINDEGRLPKSQTFDKWTTMDIPTVKKMIQDIPNQMNTSKQYNLTIPDKVGSLLKPEEQAMYSALANYRACKNEEPNKEYACNDRFINKDYFYARPKSCLAKIIEEKTDVTNADGEIQDWDKFDTTDSEKVLNNWGTKNDYGFKQLLMYGNKNDVETKYSNYNDKLQSDFINKVKCSTSTTECHNNYSYFTGTSAIENIKLDRYVHPYDEILLASYYIYGKPLRQASGTTGAINLQFWQDDNGGTREHWVKLCWEDFRDFLKEGWAPNDEEFITKEGNINLTNDTYESLRNLIEYKGNSTLPHKKFRNLITTYKDPDTNFDIPVQLNRMGGVFITEETYKHPWFPFWRILPVKHYIKKYYTPVTTQRTETRNTNKANVAQETNTVIQSLYTFLRTIN